MSSSRALNPTGGTRSENKLDKIAVHLEYTCFICGNILSSAKQTINHVRRIHNYDILSRAGHKRPQNNEFTYVRDKKGPWTIQEYACPSCWFHCPEDDLEALNEHTRETHDPVKVDPSRTSDKEDDGGYTSAESAISARAAARRSGSVGPSRSGSAGPSTNGRPRRGSSVSFEADDPKTLDTAREIGRRIEEITNLLKSFFN